MSKHITVIAYDSITDFYTIANDAHECFDVLIDSETRAVTMCPPGKDEFCVEYADLIVDACVGYFDENVS